jgi:hypothetical protein
MAELAMVIKEMKQGLPHQAKGFCDPARVRAVPFDRDQGFPDLTV